jgi:HPt (histidine-containing phosphotransfer) domain-containing protein
MTLHMEQVHWMPSPPLAPDDGPIDRAHLARMTLGDPGLEREELAMFAGQSASLVDHLAGSPPNAADLAHTLKGSAMAIGAFRVADAADWLETALRNDDSGAEPLMALADAVTEAGLAIGCILKRS